MFILYSENTLRTAIVTGPLFSSAKGRSEALFVDWGSRHFHSVRQDHRDAIPVLAEQNVVRTNVYEIKVETDHFLQAAQHRFRLPAETAIRGLQERHLQPAEVSSLAGGGGGVSSRSSRRRSARAFRSATGGVRSR